MRPIDEGVLVDPSYLRQLVIDRTRHHNESPEEGADSTARGLRIPRETLDPIVEAIRRQGRMNQLLDSPPGVYDHGLENEARLGGWYTGPERGDVFWPRLRRKLEDSGLRDVVDDIDNASTKVVAHMADPHIYNLKKRGLVVGYVQSGKTANYTAAMAKAADAGYRLFIILSGLHNNLRRQTQVRIDNDLLDDDWTALTTESEDFGNVINGAAMLKKDVKSVAVVKKNQARLRSVLSWLREIPEEIRKRTPILILDDEADQATPNSAAGRDQLTRINELVRKLWAEVRSGTYIGYTATPFANVFMDPHDEQELYPADFIIDLPRPAAYFGAERLFGREPLHDADEPEGGLDMVRHITDEDALQLRPPSSKDERVSFDPDLPGSLVDAVIWFIVATAIRRARGEVSEHSSMLVHTTHYVAPHFAVKRRLVELLAALRKDYEAGASGSFRRSYDAEAGRAAEIATRPLPDWDEVEPEVGSVLDVTRVVVDNGASDDRLDYGRTESGEPVVETVIAVGGGTLSRGLTLEGLVVSYFTRTSNTYDTLLQMGRWFGYRPGYEDLPRIWMQASLADDFRFLSLIEHEIRQDMLDMARQNLTPKQLGIRVRAHPGRLAIVARNKMHHAEVVRLSYSGKRLQTFILEEQSLRVIDHNRRTVAGFISDCARTARDFETNHRTRWLFKDIPAEKIASLVEEYEFHPDQLNMRPEHIAGWIRRAAPDNPWNVVVIGNSRTRKNQDGGEIELGSMDLGLESQVPAVNRAPLHDSPVGTANIKALLSHHDWFADLDPAERKALGERAKEPRAVRREYSGGRGLLIVYPISKNSVPMGPVRLIRSRRSMTAPDHLVGLGLVFPDIERADFADEGTYYSVHPDWEPVATEEEDIPEDLEGSAQVDGEREVQRHA